MNCIECNKEIDYDSSFCKYCGHKINQSELLTNTKSISFPYPAFISRLHARVIGPKDVKPGKKSWWEVEPDIVGRWMEVSFDLLDEHNRPTKATGYVEIYLLEAQETRMETNPTIEFLKEKSVFNRAYNLEYDNFSQNGHLIILAKSENDGLIYAKRDFGRFVTAGTEHGGTLSHLFVVIYAEDNRVLRADYRFSWGDSLF